MNGKLFTILVFSGNVAFATGFPTPADYECCKAFLDGEDQTQECADRFVYGQLWVKTQDRTLIEERCRLVVEGVDEMIRKEEQLSVPWPGTVSDVRIGNVTTEIKTSETGQPLTVILKYEVTVEENWRGNPYSRSLRWADRSIRNIMFSSRALEVIEGKVTPEPVLLNRQIPYIYSTFGFEKGNTYLYEVEFSPAFLAGFRKPYSANLPPQWTTSPCLDVDGAVFGLDAAFRRDPATFGRDPKKREETINALLAAKDPTYEFDIYLKDYRGGKVDFGQTIEILPLGEFYKGHKEAGTPECVEVGGTPMHPNNVGLIGSGR